MDFFVTVQNALNPLSPHFTEANELIISLQKEKPVELLMNLLQILIDIQLPLEERKRLLPLLSSSIVVHKYKENGHWDINTPLISYAAGVVSSFFDDSDEKTSMIAAHLYAGLYNMKLPNIVPFSAAISQIVNQGTDEDSSVIFAYSSLASIAEILSYRRLFIYDSFQEELFQGILESISKVSPKGGKYFLTIIEKMVREQIRQFNPHLIQNIFETTFNFSLLYPEEGAAALSMIIEKFTTIDQIVGEFTSRILEAVDENIERYPLLTVVGREYFDGENKLTIIGDNIDHFTSLVLAATAENGIDNSAFSCLEYFACINFEARDILWQYVIANIGSGDDTERFTAAAAFLACLTSVPWIDSEAVNVCDYGDPEYIHKDIIGHSQEYINALLSDSLSSIVAIGITCLRRAASRGSPSVDLDMMKFLIELIGTKDEDLVASTIKAIRNLANLDKINTNAANYAYESLIHIAASNVGEEEITLRNIQRAFKCLRFLNDKCDPELLAASSELLVEFLGYVLESDQSHLVTYLVELMADTAHVLGQPYGPSLASALFDAGYEIESAILDRMWKEDLWETKQSAMVVFSMIVMRDNEMSLADANKLTNYSYYPTFSMAYFHPEFVEEEFDYLLQCFNKNSPPVIDCGPMTIVITKRLSDHFNDGEEVMELFAWFRASFRDALVKANNPEAVSSLLEATDAIRRVCPLQYEIALHQNSIHLSHLKKIAKESDCELIDSLMTPNEISEVMYSEGFY